MKKGPLTYWLLFLMLGGVFLVIIFYLAEDHNDNAPDVNIATVQELKITERTDLIPVNTSGILSQQKEALFISEGPLNIKKRVIPSPKSVDLPLETDNNVFIGERSISTQKINKEQSEIDRKSEEGPHSHILNSIPLFIKKIGWKKIVTGYDKYNSRLLSRIPSGSLPQPGEEGLLNTESSNRLDKTVLGSGSSRIIVSIEGNYSFVEQFVSGSSLSDITLRSHGWNNKVIQNVLMMVNAGVLVDQRGNYNTIRQKVAGRYAGIFGYASMNEIRQRGNFNFIRTDQYGSANLIDTFQNGQFNNINIKQDGRGNVSRVSQGGQGNTVIIRQY